MKNPKFCKQLKNKWYNLKVRQKRFHLNGHTIGFRPQTQKLKVSITGVIGEQYSHVTCMLVSPMYSIVARMYSNVLECCSYVHVCTRMLLV